MEQIDLLKFTATRLLQLRIPYAIVGSFASSVWGESRLTQDIDIVVDLKPGHILPICAAFPEPEFYVSATAIREAIENSRQFNVINPSSGNEVDFIISGRTAWVVEQISRSRQILLFPNLSVNFAAPEDAILGKLNYYRDGGSEKHLRDINGVLDISSDLVDPKYIAMQAKQLGVDDLWEAIRNSRSPG